MSALIPGLPPRLAKPFNGETVRRGDFNAFGTIDIHWAQIKHLAASPDGQVQRHARDLVKDIKDTCVAMSPRPGVSRYSRGRMSSADNWRIGWRGATMYGFEYRVTSRAPYSKYVFGGTAGVPKSGPRRFPIAKNSSAFRPRVLGNRSPKIPRSAFPSLPGGKLTIVNGFRGQAENNVPFRALESIFRIRNMRGNLSGTFEGIDF